MIANRHLNMDSCVNRDLAICLSVSDGKALDSIPIFAIPIFATFNIIINAFIKFGRTDSEGTPTARVNEAQHNDVVDVKSTVSADIFLKSVVWLLQSNKIREQLRSDSRTWFPLSDLDSFINSGMYKCRVMWSIEYIADCIKTRSEGADSFAMMVLE